MKTAIPLVVALVFSPAGLTSDDQADAGLQLQQQVQASTQTLIENRLERELPDQPFEFKVIGGQRLALRIPALRPQSPSDSNTRPAAGSMSARARESNS